MADSELIVTTSYEVPDAGEEGGMLRLAGRDVRLDPARGSIAGILAVLRRVKEEGLPIAVRVDADGIVEDVRLPLVGHVVRLEGDERRLELELDTSHALLRLGKESLGLAPVLRRALAVGVPVIVTVDDASRIIDARPFVLDPEGPLPPLPPLRPPFPPRRPWFVPIWELLRHLLRWPWWPWWWWFGLSRARAQQLFDQLATLSCAPLTVPAPCIPFLYPDDGCWGRAHEMSRLLIAKGVTPGKVWIRGGLRVATRNNPTCAVRWGWHVAPTVIVRRFPWLSRRMVIDPSLFATPVTEAVWKGVQGDPAATLTQTSWTKFSDWYPTDPTYVETNRVLAQYRAALQLRSLQQGPPPYSNC
ncbi:protein-glutamine glutaminase family protein [Microbacterium sp.]|uniref:protein-glutamine glutaminase family protein n=1 Tax=Microbacterium sp. TaxID=51671 RepID=UPI0039E28AF4